MQSNCEIKQNKQLIKTPKRQAAFQRKEPNVMHTQTHRTTESAGHSTVTALKTEAKKIHVWLYPPSSAS